MKTIIIHVIIGIFLIAFAAYVTFVLPNEVHYAAQEGVNIPFLKKAMYDIGTGYGLLLVTIAVSSFLIGPLCKAGIWLFFGWAGSVLILAVSWWCASISNPVVFPIGALISMAVIVSIGVWRMRALPNKAIQTDAFGAADL